jgi:hypothetical protein
MVITNMGVFCSALPQEGDGDPFSEGVFTDPFFSHYSKQNTWFSEHLVVSPERLGFLPSHLLQLFTVVSKKTKWFRFADFFCLVFVWFQKTKQVFGFLQIVYVCKCRGIL